MYYIAEKNSTTKSQNVEVTCLAASTGLLWIGTSLGLILTLPLPRLKDGVPLYRGHPFVSYHGHRGPVRWVQYSLSLSFSFLYTA